MFKKKYFFLFLILAVSGTYSLFSLEPVLLTNSKGEYHLGLHLEILEDKDKKWSIEDVVSPGLSGNFVRSREEAPNFGYSNSVYWIRFKLKNNSSRKEWLLEIGYPLLDLIELYIPSPDFTGKRPSSFVMKKSGDSFPFNEREIKHQNVVFGIALDPEAEKTFYLRIKSSGTMQFPMVIHSSKNFVEKNHRQGMAYGLYYGIILAMFLYNLFLLFSLRDMNYLYYVLYITGYGLLQISLNGLAYEYLWPGLPWWNNRSVPFFIAFAVLWVSKFSSSFLQTKVHSPWINRVFQLLIGISALVMLWSLVGNYTTAIMIAGILTLVFIATALSAGLISWLKGFRLAKFFVIAWSILMFGTSLYILRSFGILPSNIITVNSMQIGSALEVILLSLALADRINIIRKEKEEAQELAIANLHKADKLKDEFLANTSHELKTPLNGIIGIAESMIGGVTGQLTSAQQSHLSMILSSGNRLLYLVNDILDSSRLKYNDIILQLKPVDMRQVTELVIILSKPLLGKKPVKLVNEIGGNLPPVLGDENRLQQIMHNLIGNAIKFTDSGTIRVTALESDHHLEISISDTGIGIPEDKLTDIFKPFNQADPSTARVYGGTGLGLSITKELIELHGGTIRAESLFDRGSKFVFTLPLSDKHIEAVSNDKSGIDIKSVEPIIPNTELVDSLNSTGNSFNSILKGRTAKILAVDDDPINLQVVTDYLSLDGYKADKALSGIEALKAIDREHYDLVLLDVMMPRMNGYEVCRKIRETHPLNELPVIMLTAKNQIPDLVEGFGAGANDYVTKPILQGELLARVKSHLKSALFFKELQLLNKRMDILLKEFSRVAFKIHNSLKNKLESIRNFLMHSIRFNDDREKLIENLLIANKLIEHCSNESKNILFVISNKECKIETLLAEFELQAQLAFTGREIDYSIHSNKLPEKRILKPEVVQNLLDLYTEVLNNIVKHSSAAKVDIGIDYEDNQISLVVKDDGTGFHYETQREKKGSYGLKMMEELNEEIKGVFSVNSKPGVGTTVKIRVKI